MTFSSIGKTASLLETAVEVVLDTQHSSGGWVVPPDPRILETALAFHALATLRSVGSARDLVGDALLRTRRWLMAAEPQSHSPIAATVERALRDIALGRATGIDLTHREFDDTVYSSRMLLLHVVGLSAGCKVHALLTPECLRAQIAARYAEYKSQTPKPWSAVELLAVRALIESFFGHEDTVAEAAEFIRSYQDSEGSFFQNPISTSMALLALHAADVNDPAVRRGCRWLLNAQWPDGTWRFCTCDVWDTTLVIRSFRRHPVFSEQALPRALEFLSAMQNDDGGWGFGGRAQSDNDTTGAALLALPTNHRDKKQISRAVDYLALQQARNGLWRTWQFDHDPPAQDTVAHVLAGLARFSAHHRIPLEPACRWLVRQYDSSVCGWHASWYYNSSYAQLEVGRALGFAHPLVQSAMERLAATQNADGGWGRMPGEQSCASATGLAVSALARYRWMNKRALAAAVSFLAKTQRSDGTWPGVPEMLGPRPLLTHMPIETQAFAALGIGSLHGSGRRGQG